jgi:uncharacterized protein YndB with AHSA1/START domain
MPVTPVRNSETFKVTTPSDTEIRMTRLFDAPRRLVFEVLTRPEHVRRWWGNLGEGYSVPVCEIDLRPGGKWRFMGRGPDGDIPAFYGEFSEIVPPERIVQTEIFEPYPDAPGVNTTILTEENGKTRVTVTSAYGSKEIRDMVLQSGMETGAAISYDRLEDVARELAGAA